MVGSYHCVKVIWGDFSMAFKNYASQKAAFANMNSSRQSYTSRTDKNSKNPLNNINLKDTKQKMHIVDIQNYEIVSDIESMEGKPGIYYRVEAYGGTNTSLDTMHSVIGADQIDIECDLCGTEIDLDDLDAGCPDCGGEASQGNKYAKMIDDFNLKPNSEGDYILPGILAFDSYSDVEEYANRVPRGEIVAYKGKELYYGTQEPDFGGNEFLISPKTRYRDKNNI